jgi:cytochrome c553
MPGPFQFESHEMRRAKLAKSIACLIAVALSLVAPVFAGDLAAGRTKALALCQNCHAVDGAGIIPGAANLGGQQKEYLREQLRAFRSGSRQNPQMTFITKPLTDADIEDLSEWFSAMKVTIELPK